MKIQERKVAREEDEERGKRKDEGPLARSSRGPSLQVLPTYGLAGYQIKEGQAAYCV